MKESLISVIVPVYNVEGFVTKCLESIAAQTYPGFECIIVDDGSTDNTGAICDAFCVTDARFKVIHQENRGVGFARNTGLDISKGEYIQFVDGDDALSPDTFEYTLRLIQSDTYDWVSYEYTYVDVTGDALSTSETSDFGVIAGEDALRRMLVGPAKGRTVFKNTTNKLYSRRILGGFRFRFQTYEDFPFNTQVYLCTKKAYHSNKRLYLWTRRPGSITFPIDKESSARSSLAAMLSYSSLLNIVTPNNNSRFRSVFLIAIYRKLMFTRYKTTNTTCYIEFLNHYKQITKQTVREYLTNIYIPFREKVMVVSMMLFPFLGRLTFRIMGN